MSERKEGEPKGLPLQLRLENVLCALAHPVINPFTLSAIVQYTVNCHLRAKRKRIGMSVQKLSFTNLLQGDSCAGICKMLQNYGVSTQLYWICWDMMGDTHVVIHCEILVPATQAEYADMILRWSEGDTYLVTSKQICKDVYYPGKPWGITAKPRSWDAWITEILFGWMGARSAVPKPVQKELKEREKESGVTQAKAKGATTKSIKKSTKKRKPKKRATVFGRGKELIGKIF